MRSLFLAILGLMDLAGGIMLYFGSSNFYVGLLFLLKGLYSITMSALANFYFDFLGWVDLLAGLTFLFSLAYLSRLIGIALFLKGIYSLFFSVI